MTTNVVLLMQQNLFFLSLYKIDKGTKFMELSALACYNMYGGNGHAAGIVTGIGLVLRENLILL